MAKALNQEYYNRLDSETKKKKYLMRFKCSWCGFEFEQYNGKTDAGKKSVSSQVQCQICNNYVKTWGD